MNLVAALITVAEGVPLAEFSVAADTAAPTERRDSKDFMRVEPGT